ncbi:MAG TPA: hydantoinase/oxoprolinase family protein [Candidatus Heimdallarchaeota archaeon]|nr:hydantoinase/oxoprolinase family protein [Candidatus Heimdallarchaeota archaeon]
MHTVIGIDIGGTFIDIVVIDNGRLRLFKVPSTPQAPADGVIAGLAKLIEQGEVVPAQVRRIAHGSTIATNALLERKWAKTALVTTRGFRDVLEIGRQNRPCLYDLFFERIAPIVPRNLRIELAERVDARGEILRSLNQEEVECLIPWLRENGVEAVAVVFLFSYLNSTHERAVGEHLEANLELPVSLSCEVLPEFREYERTSTTVVSAALQPVIGGYLTALEHGANQLGLGANWQIMQSSGTITRAKYAQADPARILLSGPAAGVEGARAIGQLAGFDQLITLDMGGTSCDVALIQNGEIGRTTTGKIGGHPIGHRMLEVHTIGAGGGSIAWLDSGGVLRVGPQSAGASPGPACYGRGGTEPTVTDAHLVLGHLLSDRPLGGLGSLDEAAAKKAIATVATPLDLTVEAAALGILKVADAAMERAIRVISIERGYDPRDFVLLAFGGAGPLHAVSIARQLAIPMVVVPTVAGVLSAFGLLAAKFGHDFGRGLVRLLREVEPEMLEEILTDLCRRGKEELRADGVSKETMSFQASADLRYLGQAHEITVPLPGGDLGTLEPRTIDPAFIDQLETAFRNEHQRRYGHAAPDEPIELVAVRVQAVGPGERVTFTPQVREAVEATVKPAWFSMEGPIETKVVHRDGLAQGDELPGPAIVLSADATVLLPPETIGRADRYGNLIVEVQ